jgi:hypothetical protein
LSARTGTVSRRQHTFNGTGLALDPNFTFRRFRDGAVSNNPTFLAKRERVYQGMRMAGYRRGDVRVGSKAVLTASTCDFSSVPNNGHHRVGRVGPFRAITGSRNAPVHYGENGFLKLNGSPVRQAASILPSWLMPGIIRTNTEKVMRARRPSYRS